jgi:peptidoglycan hydrolase-like protein with peptidoglycan-binding domain
MSTGYITVKVFTAEKAMPVQRAQVRIVDLRIALDQTIYTDQYGNAERIKVYAPERETSLKPQDITLPYETYNIEVVKDGYIPTIINNVPIFPGVVSIQPVAMMPQPQGEKFASLVNNFELPPNGLLLKGEKPPTSAPETYNPLQTKPVFIPEIIRVHLGEPGSDDKTVLVPFTDYIKNVASSEIYATWPKESLQANILAFISYALNRIYTGFYPAKGYNYDVTANPNHDPYYVDGRNIYGNISDMVDEIFNEFIRRVGFNEPLLANYCNGVTTRCEGLSQWGSVTLANQGKTAEDIVKYYYGNVQTEKTQEISGVEKKYPGKLIRLGDVGPNVMAIQQQLNQIGKTYNNIPDIPVENGNFDAYTQDAVRAFQKQFNLSPDGIVGKKTWYQLAFVYNAAQRLLVLSRNRKDITVPEKAPDTTLKEGDKGANVRLLQYLLNAVSVFYNSVFPVEEDGTFSKNTTNSVNSFQKTFSLAQTGTVDAATWNALLDVYRGIEEQAGAVMDMLAGSRRSGAEEQARQGREQEAAPRPMGTTGPGAGAPAESRGETGPGRGAEAGGGMRSARSGEGMQAAGLGGDQRITEAMDYANGVYPFGNRGQINMAYSSDILDYIPETYPVGEDMRSTGTESGMKEEQMGNRHLTGATGAGQNEMPETDDETGISRGGKWRTQPGETIRGSGMTGGQTGGVPPKEDAMPKGGYSQQMYTPGMMDDETGISGSGAGRTQPRGQMRESSVTGRKSGGMESKPESGPQGIRSYQMYTPGMTDDSSGTAGGGAGGMQQGTQRAQDEDMNEKPARSGTKGMGGQMQEQDMTGGQTGGMQQKEGSPQGSYSYQLYTPGIMDTRTGIPGGGTGGRMREQDMTEGQSMGMQSQFDRMMPRTSTFQMYNPWIMDDQAGGTPFGPLTDSMGSEERQADSFNFDNEPFNYTPWMPRQGGAGFEADGAQSGRQVFEYYEPEGVTDAGRESGTDSMRGMRAGPTGVQPETTQQGPAGMQSQRMRMPGGTPPQSLGQIYQMRMQPGTPPGMARERAEEPARTGTSDQMECPPLPMVNPPFQNKVLKIGSKGKDVQLMQEYLSYIALSLKRYKKITNELKVVVNDGIYGIDTTDAVIRFQNRYEMPVNGVIDAPTWEKIVEVYNTPCD